MLTARGLRRRLNLELAASLAVVPVWGAAGAFAAWRLLIGRAPLAVAAALAAGAVAALLLRLRREAWSEAEALVMLDRLAGAGGLALALHEAPGPEWSARLESKLAAARPPRLRVARPLAWIAGALALGVAASLLPGARPSVPAAQTAALARVEKAGAQAEPLAAENALDGALRRELERLRAEAGQGRFDASDWAALDALGEGLGQAAAQREAQLAAAAMAAEQLAAQLDAKGTQEAERRARESLEQALSALSSGAPGAQASPGGERAGAPAARPSPPDAARARQLARALDRRREALRRGAAGERVEQASCRGGQGTGGQSCQSDGSGQGAGERQAADGSAGSGGVARGPGAAPVTFGAPHAVAPDRLPIVGLESEDEGDRGELLGVLGLEPARGVPGATASPGAAAPGEDGIKAREAPLAPRHRDVVKRYFDPLQRNER